MKAEMIGVAGEDGRVGEGRYCWGVKLMRGWRRRRTAGWAGLVVRFALVCFFSGALTAILLFDLMSFCCKKNSGSLPRPLYGLR
jgi:hypothetical protein